MITQKDIARFWAGVDRDRRSENDCWNWMRSTTNGYGQFSLDGGRTRTYAHRFSAYLAGIVEALPVENHTSGRDLVLHSCDNPRCCNPRHLSKGDMKQNIFERDARGRHRPPRGEANSFAKLSATDIVEIREFHALGFQQKDIAAAYKVSRSRVCMIVAKKSWGHVV